mgnify:CR=1 FL=1
MNEDEINKTEKLYKKVLEDYKEYIHLKRICEKEGLE